jgi:pteridine reductase
MKLPRNIQHQGTVLITGAAKRIGRDIALGLSTLGYRIAIHYRSSRRDAEDLQNQIRLSGGACEIFFCDLGNVKQAQKLIGQVRKRCPDLNVLVNNASIFEKDNFQTATLSTLEKHLTIHVKAPFILTQDFARLCRRGNVINMLDTSMVKNATDHVTYLLSKKALFELTKMVAVALAPNIRVNGICPGLILPPVYAPQSKYLDRMATKIPLKAKGHPGLIVQSVVFLLENPYLTGQVIFNDGGEHLV